MPRYDFVIVDECRFDQHSTVSDSKIAAPAAELHFMRRFESDRASEFFFLVEVKSLFYRQDDFAQRRRLIRILNPNYRNSPQVTEIGTDIEDQNQRFGSMRQGKHYLVKSNGHTQGEVLCWKTPPAFAIGNK